MATHLLTNEDLSVRLHAEFAQLTLPEMPVSDQLESIVAKVAQLSVTSYIGTVGMFGQDSAGGYQVLFNVENRGGFSSIWPQWAYEHAKLAKLYAKQLLVIANGDPFGSKLLVVSVF
jgi:hypothetical protein